MQSGDEMLNPEFIDKNYGVGNYIIINCSSDFSGYFLSAGYNVLLLDELSSIEICIENNYDFLIINLSGDLLNAAPEKLFNILNYHSQSIKKIILVTNKGEVDSSETGYIIENVKSMGFDYDKVLQNLLLSNHHEENMAIFALSRATKNNVSDEKIERELEHLVHYIRPNEDVCVISEDYESFNTFLSQNTIAKNIRFFKSTELYQDWVDKKGTHFFKKDIKTDYFDCFFILDNIGIECLNSLSPFSENLSPGGRIVFKSDSFKDFNGGKLFEIEVFYTSLNSNIKDNSGCNIIEGVLDNYIVAMKNPLEDIDNFTYIEKTYSYSSPPKNLLMFERDYINPWIVKSMVEFPTRNKNKFALKRYAEEIIKKYNKISPDYAAALAILGYQGLASKNSHEEIVDEIKSYITNVGKIRRKSPHQIRWLISLSVLCAELLKLQNKKSDALRLYKTALTFKFDKFSATIGTKILQAYYNIVIMLYTSGDKNASNDFLIKGLEVGVDILNVSFKELLGCKENPLNFTLFIYHDIIDWLIKLSNLKKYLGYKDQLIPTLNGQVWSEILKERMRAINEMENMIKERDKAISSQGEMLEERMHAINQLENIVKSQQEIIEERWNAMQEMEQMIIERDNTISELKLLTSFKE